MMKRKVLMTAIMAVSLTFAGWVKQTDTDVMTGITTSSSFTDETSATQTMDFPYQGVTARLVISSNSKGEEWIYIMFSEAPNLLNGEIYDGGNTYKIRTKFDNSVEIATMNQEWGSKFLHFKYDQWAKNKIDQSSSLLIEINWYGNGRTYFEFDLTK